MGSHLYISIQRRVVGSSRAGAWFDLFDGPSGFLDRGPVVDAFGSCDPEDAISHAPGYLSQDDRKRTQEHEECPWRLDEPYWVRQIPGAEFVAIVREKLWQGDDWKDLECTPELRSYAAFVEALMQEGLEVRVWCWHSQ